MFDLIYSTVKLLDYLLRCLYGFIGIYVNTCLAINKITNMSKEGKHISMDTLARICETLDCGITDVIDWSAMCLPPREGMTMKELKERITENGIDYILIGDYYYPDLKLPEESRSIGHYGRLHRKYLKQEHPVRYSSLAPTGKLWVHLAGLNEQADEQYP